MSAHQSLSGQLTDLLQREHGFTLDELLHRMGDKGFGLFLIVLSLPSALPVPAPGYSVPFGIVLMIIAVQMLMLRTAPVLPGRFGRARVESDTAARMVAALSWFFGKVEWIIRPRMRWIASRSGRLCMGLLVACMAALMIVPIPLTNTLPAMVIFLIGVGLSEEDGLFALFACVLGICAVLLYGALVFAIITYGPEVVVQIKDWLRAVIRPN